VEGLVVVAAQAVIARRLFAAVAARDALLRASSGSITSGTSFRRREGSEPAEVLLGLRDRFDTHFLESAAWRRARLARDRSRHE
jgi:hypothetical protein